MTTRWPEVGLDPITQLRAMHTALPGSALVERVYDTPFDEVWAKVDDIATFAMTIDPLVLRLRLVERDGERIDLKQGPLRLHGELRPGFCWMQTRGARLFFVGMAAMPTDDGRTRWAHMEGMRLPGARVLRPWFRRTVGWDLAGIERLLGEGR
jgi:hypothetical protein